MVSGNLESREEEKNTPIVRGKREKSDDGEDWRIDFAWDGNRIRGFESSVPFVVVKASTTID